MKKIRYVLRKIHDWNDEGLIRNKILNCDNDFIVGSYILQVPNKKYDYYKIIFKFKFLKNENQYKNFLFRVTDTDV